MPDEELLDLAARGELTNRDVLEKQVRRMLADERAKSLVTNFAGQWLYLRNLDSGAFPTCGCFPISTTICGGVFKERDGIILRERYSRRSQHAGFALRRITRF